MKQNLLAVVLALSSVGLAGCAVQQPVQQAPQQAGVDTTNEQVQAPTQQQQPQGNSFLGDIIKTATETLSNEAQKTVRSSIQEAGSAARN